MTSSAIKSRVTSFAPQFLVDDLERSLASPHVSQLSNRCHAGRAGAVTGF